jgi:hypothetical protein
MRRMRLHVCNLIRDKELHACNSLEGGLYE